MYRKLIYNLYNRRVNRFEVSLLFTRAMRFRSFPAENNEPSSKAVTRVGHLRAWALAMRRTRILALDPRAWRIRRFQKGPRRFT